MRITEIKNAEPRREHGNLKELAENIKKEGLLQPLVINQNNELIAGRRRYEAVKLLGWNEVNVYQIETIDDIDKLSKALAENIQRKQLTWQEEVQQKEELEQLITEKYGKREWGGNRKSSSPDELEKPTLENIARETKQSVGKLSQDLQLAKAIKENPELEKIKTKKGALKELKKIKHNEEIQKKIREMKENKMENENIKFFHGDFRNLIEDIPENSIDLIVTDAPYGKEYLDLWKSLGESAQRVLKPSKYLIVYTGKLYLPFVIGELGKYLEYYWTIAIEFTGFGAKIVPGMCIIDCWRPVLIFYKPPLKKPRTFRDWIEGKKEKDYHKWQQSLGVTQKLIQNFSEVGDTVLDIMAGTGTTLIASTLENRKAIGFEKEKENINIIRVRLDEYDRKNK